MLSDRFFRYALTVGLCLAFLSPSSCKKQKEEETVEYPTFTTAITPTQVGTGTDWADVEASETFFVALKTDGTLWVWGWVVFGLGEANVGAQDLPVQIGTSTDWVMISCAGRNAFALRSNGTLWGWGENWAGSLGVGDDAARYEPTQVGNTSNWKSVTTSLFVTCGIKTNGELWCWGASDDGYLVTSYNTVYYPYPAQVGIETDWDKVSGGEVLVALKDDNTAWAWEADDWTTVLGATPEKIGEDEDWSVVSSARANAILLKSDGTIWGWGGVDYSVGLANDYPDFLTTPKQIGTSTQWVSISRGINYHTLAIKNNGSLWGCGANYFGQLGIGTEGTGVNSSSFVQVGSATNWAEASAGYDTSVAVKTNGTLWMWGIVGVTGNYFARFQ